MGWIAVNNKGETLYEDRDGRPMEAGEKGELVVIAQEDYHRRIAVDLLNGIIHLDYDELEVAEDGVAIKGAKATFRICDETNIVGDLFETVSSEPDEQGNFTNSYKKLVWRPIWFTRHTLGATAMAPIKCIGAQTTLPKEFGGKNIKKLVSIFSDTTIGID